MQKSWPGAVPGFQGGKVAQEREGTGCVLLHAYTFTAPAQLVTVLWGWNGCHGQTGEVAAPMASLAPLVLPAVGDQHTTLTKSLFSPAWGGHPPAAFEQLREFWEGIQAASFGTEPAQQCRLSSGKVTPFAFYPSVIPTLTGAIKRQPGVMKLSGRRDLNPNELRVRACPRLLHLSAVTPRRCRRVAGMGWDSSGSPLFPCRRLSPVQPPGFGTHGGE